MLSTVAPAPKLLAISGSIRVNSANTAILTTLRDELRPIADLTIFPLNDVPLYSNDLEGPDLPAAVAALRASIANCDGVVLCSPEYNYGTSGVLKNALDWASRPAFASPLKGKPALIMTSSPGALGGVRAHQQVRDTLVASLARVVVGPYVVIPHVLQKLTDGRLTDEPTIRFALDAVGLLLAEIGLLDLAGGRVASAPDDTRARP